MPRLAHLTPCNACPFRRDSAPGWLGASDAHEFIQAALSECQMPCHCTIDYEDPHWEQTQYPDAPICAGSLVFLRNNCKLPRDETLKAMTRAVEQDRESVFCFRQEFVDHHEGVTNGSKGRA